jgi:hypothetical protein
VLSQPEDISSAAVKLYNAVANLFVENRARSKTLSREFHPDEVQPGHTYFLARKLEELVHKFTYQVYPLLREYYKDGVFSGDTISLPDPFSGVTLSQPMQPEEVEKEVWRELGGQGSSNDRS